MFRCRRICMHESDVDCLTRNCITCQKHVQYAGNGRHRNPAAAGLVEREWTTAMHTQARVGDATWQYSTMQATAKVKADCRDDGHGNGQSRSNDQICSKGFRCHEKPVGCISDYAGHIESLSNGAVVSSLNFTICERKQQCSALCCLQTDL